MRHTDDTEEQIEQLNLLIKLLPFWDGLIDAKYNMVRIHSDMARAEEMLPLGSSLDKETLNEIRKAIDFRRNAGDEKKTAEKKALREIIVQRVEKMFPDLVETSSVPLIYLLNEKNKWRRALGKPEKIEWEDE